MTEPDDIQLLREYADDNSEDAFAALVRRHVNLVYSVALRNTGDTHKAGEVTQAVFIILAQRAARLHKNTVLTGWLYQTARFTAASFLRGERRRQHREQESFMQSTLDQLPADASWEQFAPLLDQAMGRLGETDRNLILLRFFEGRSAADAGVALNLNVPAAKRRCTRAIEKLRRYFSRHGIDSTATAITETISSHSVQAAPALLAKSITAIALAKGATASVSTLTLIKGALKIMAWTKAKAAVVIGLTTILAVGTATVAVKQISRHRSLPGRDNVSVGEIVTNTLARYASLTSYRDEGTVESTFGAQSFTHTFTTMLARTNLFRVAWTQNIGFSSTTGMVWSAGDSSFLQMKGAPLQTFSDRRTALASATGISGGAASTVPGTFFQQNRGNVLGAVVRGGMRQADERIGDADCLVLASTMNGITYTLWIGRDDSLIHRIRTVTSAAALKAILQTAAKRNPNLPAMPAMQDTTMIETHSNIVVDTLTPMDFQPLNVSY